MATSKKIVVEEGPGAWDFCKFVMDGEEVWFTFHYKTAKVCVSADLLSLTPDDRNLNTWVIEIKISCGNRSGKKSDLVELSSLLRVALLIGQTYDETAKCRIFYSLKHRRGHVIE